MKNESIDIQTRHDKIDALVTALSVFIPQGYEYPVALVRIRSLAEWMEDLREMMVSIDLQLYEDGK